MGVAAWFKEITFNDGTKVDLNKDDIIVLVGPNNCGKSVTLRGLRDVFQDSNSRNVVIKNGLVQKDGTPDELIQWLEKTTSKKQYPTVDTYRTINSEVNADSAKNLWAPTVSLGRLTRFFCHLLTADERLQAANPPPNIKLLTDAPQHPIHYLQRDDGLEEKVSLQFKRAFGVDLIVNRNAGGEVPLHVGQKPRIKSGQDKLLRPYAVELAKLPMLHDQGDGMRSYAGVLLYTSVGSETVLLVDEPEAFLHPPQARNIGQMMVINKPDSRQLFVATHSGDVLRGILNSNSRNIRVIRLRRNGDINIASKLDNDKIAQLWNDPLLRYSNILDGLFNEKVVVCESDGDCRFYSAILDSLYEADTTEQRKPDIMFTHCGGKARLPLVIQSLKELNVPIAAIADFDVLNDERPLRQIYEATGGDWACIENDWKQVKASIDSKKPELNTNEVKKEITAILNKLDGGIFPATGKKNIQDILRRSSPWSTAKSMGSAFVPSGQPTQACNRLLEALRKSGIFVVPVGELEGFCKSVGTHGPSWVNEVLKKDIKGDQELELARRFVKSFVL